MENKEQVLNLDFEASKKFCEDLRKKWLDRFSSYPQLLGNVILPLEPGLGTYIKVQDLNIYEDIFLEEFNMIHKAYNQVLSKLNEHHKNRIINNDL